MIHRLPSGQTCDRCDDRLVCRLAPGARGAVIVDAVSRSGSDVVVTLTHWREGDHRAYQSVERHVLRLEGTGLTLVESEVIIET